MDLAKKLAGWTVTGYSFVLAWSSFLAAVLSASVALIYPVGSDARADSWMMATFMMATSVFARSIGRK